jgi:hypothetical protein
MFTPEVLQAKESTPTPYPFVIFTLDSHLNLSKSLGVHHVETFECRCHDFNNIAQILV